MKIVTKPGKVTLCFWDEYDQAFCNTPRAIETRTVNTGDTLPDVGNGYYWRPDTAEIQEGATHAQGVG